MYLFLLSDLIHFQVGVWNGQVYTKHPVDYEEVQQVDFQVVGYDHGFPTQKGLTNVTVIVHDVNDNRPEWLRSFYDLEVRSDVDIGTVITTLKAVDRDSGKALGTIINLF